MCECTLIADGEFSPITINENNLRFIYKDKRGIEHVLIKEFVMNVTITKALVKEKKKDGKVIGYLFEVS